MNDNYFAYDQDPHANIEDQARTKTQPSRFSSDYLHIFDLNAFISNLETKEAIILLDFGSGTSPYRKYFPNADYRRADLKGITNLRYIINSDSRVEEEAETFDLILSTQVAEHLGKPDIYFKECHRLLKKGGRLLLTTHGFWEEHGVPFDFQRWTATGLRRDLTQAGFLEMEVFKLTCGFRAALLLMTRGLLSQEAKPKPGLVRLAFKGFRTIYRRLMPILHWLSDTCWSESKIVAVTETDPGPAWYIVIAAIAQK